MFDKFKKKENKKTDLYSLLPKEKYYGNLVLDDKNILVAKYNNGIYCITHYSLIDNSLKVVAKWNQYNLKCFGNTIFNYVLNNEYIFIPSIKNYSTSYQSIYNYKTHKFIIKNNVFDSITVFPYKEHSNKTFLLGEINITNECPYIEYIDSLSNKKEIYYSNLIKEKYFAILDLNGNILDNKLFLGESITKIKNIIDLNKYNSIEEFINERKEILKKENIFDNKVPYLSEEIIKVLKKY